MPALDGLRGVAVLIVLLSHAANAGLPVLPGFSLSGIGKSGVYLFFVLSAFLLTRLLLARPAGAWKSGAVWADYALRRVLRIWPLYLVVLLASFAITAIGAAPWWPYALDAGALLRHLLLLDGVSVLWSIPVEFHYYLWLPVVAAIFAFAERRGGLAGSSVAAVAAGLVTTAVWPPSASAANDVRLGPYLVLFFAGALAAVMSVRWSRSAAPAPALFGALGMAAALALLATMPATVALLGRDPFEPSLNHGWFAFFAVAWSTLVLAAVHGPAWIRRPFELRIARVLGWVSFSAYLWHMPVLAAVTGPLHLTGISAVAVFAIGTAAVSWVSWRLIERPLQRVRWHSRSASSGPDRVG
ncbi:MAG: acyltransferase family protein [Silanimonas sp.]